MHCLNATDLKLSLYDQLQETRNDETIRLVVRYIPYSFRDVQGLLLASAQITEHNAPSSFTSHAIDRLLSFLLMKDNFENLGLEVLTPGLSG